MAQAAFKTTPVATLSAGIVSAMDRFDVAIDRLALTVADGATGKVDYKALTDAISLAARNAEWAMVDALIANPEADAGDLGATIGETRMAKNVANYRARALAMPIADLAKLGLEQRGKTGPLNEGRKVLEQGEHKTLVNVAKATADLSDIPENCTPKQREALTQIAQAEAIAEAEATKKLAPLMRAAAEKWTSTERTVFMAFLATLA